MEHRHDSLYTQPLVEDMRDLCMDWSKETLAAYLWLSLQRSLRIRLDESLHGRLRRTTREELSSHCIIHQNVLQPLRVLVDGGAKGCQSSCIRRPVASTYTSKSQRQSTRIRSIYQTYDAQRSTWQRAQQSVIEVSTTHCPMVFSSGQQDPRSKLNPEQQ